MAKPGKVVREFYDALQREDYEAVKRVFADDFVFEGWFGTFDRPDPYIEVLRKLGKFAPKVEVRKVFADGDDICVFYDRHIVGGPVVAVVMWVTVREDRVKTIRVLCDSAPFAKMWGPGGPHGRLKTGNQEIRKSGDQERQEIRKSRKPGKAKGNQEKQEIRKRGAANDEDGKRKRNSPTALIS